MRVQKEPVCTRTRLRAVRCPRREKQSSPKAERISQLAPASRSHTHLVQLRVGDADQHAVVLERGRHGVRARARRETGDGLLVGAPFECGLPACWLARRLGASLEDCRLLRTRGSLFTGAALCIHAPASRREGRTSGALDRGSAAAAVAPPQTRRALHLTRSTTRLQRHTHTHTQSCFSTQQ